MTTHSTRSIAAAVLVFGLGATAHAQVTVREEPLSIPTWEIGRPPSTRSSPRPRARSTPTRRTTR